MKDEKNANPAGAVHRTSPPDYFIRRTGLQNGLVQAKFKIRNNRIAIFLIHGSVK